ncbi:MAG TPA: S1 RNA-binding domain-containing protein [Anaerolineaceae bacterium]|nr:S1 RNA-binding domain-containing protein [Anaerolineaceae bacterium]
MSKKTEAKFEEEVPVQDEGWWAAVLADEEAFTQPQKEPADKAGSQPVPPVVDWDFVQSLYEQDEIVNLTVHGFNRGGLLVQGDGIQGFVPISHLVEMANSDEEEDRRSMLSAYVGQTLQLKVIECEPAQERIVLSERAALAGEGRRKILFKSLQPGTVACGTVTNVTDFGVFIDLGGVEGLIHVSELSWGRVQHPVDVLSVGQSVQVLVLQVSEENSRIALSLKRLFSNPWETLVKRYKPGDTIPATITSITRFGAFARLEEGIEGLIHVSSIQPPPSQDLHQLFTKGQDIQVRILHIDAERRRLGLGLVQSE